MNNSVAINGLRKKYEDFELKNITFDIPKGHVVGILGENGAGKTTTIKAILNLIRKDSGNINIFDLDNIKYEKEIKENIGVVLDDSFLPNYYTPLDINKLMKIIHKNWSEKLFFEYMDKFSLPKNKKIKFYSKGMFIKLKIFVALSYKPKLLILDEPTSGLDPIARSDILDIFSDYMKNEENSILISSHITTDLERLADEIILINNGEVLFNKTRNDLLNNYLLVKCTEEEFNKISRGDYIKYKKNRFEYMVLIDKNIDFKSKYGLNSIKPTLENIMLLYIRGEE